MGSDQGAPAFEVDRKVQTQLERYYIAIYAILSPTLNDVTGRHSKEAVEAQARFARSTRIQGAADDGKRRRKHSELMERYELGCGLIKEMAPQLGQLFARLRERPTAHLRDTRGIVQGVTALWCRLVDAPDRFALMEVARDDLRSAHCTVRLAAHEEPHYRCRHR